jgi:chorismate lyase/3-hydroxybenzoate synthase
MPGLRLCFLASRRAPTALSNLRQIEAYRYPSEYGPKSPAFSRAMLMPRDAGMELHISGTASIVGHRTVHAGTLGLQIQETLRNLAALLQPLGLSLADAGSDTLLTVYLRRAEDLSEAKALLASSVAPEVKRLFIQGDICRRSLLVEIEGIIPNVDGSEYSKGSPPDCVPVS